MGELARNTENYKRDIIGKPQGAIILLNPKMDALHDVERRVEMIAQLKEIVGYLSDVGCRYVALVTTASDLLEGGTDEFKAEYKGYKNEISNALRTSVYTEGETWKEFAVTICGKLEDASRPRIARGAENTARQPFVWIVDSIDAAACRSTRVKLRTRIFSVAAFVVLAFGGALASCFWWFDRHVEREMNEEAAPVVEKLKKATGDKRFADINYCCNQLDSIAEKSGRSKPLFPANWKRLSSAITNLLLEVENGRIAWLPERLKQMSADARQKASKETCEEWRKTFSGWKPLTAQGIEFKEGLVKRFDEQVGGWRSAYEGRVFEEGSTKLLENMQTFACEGDFRSALRNILLQCRPYEERSTSDAGGDLVPLQMRQAVWKKLKKWRGECLGRTLSHKLGEFKPENVNPPVFDDKVQSYFNSMLKGILGEDDRAAFFTRVDDGVKACHAKWCEFQNGACEDFARKWKSNPDAYGAVKDYVEFRMDHCNAPRLDVAVMALHEAVGNSFMRNVSALRKGTCRNLTENFQEIRSLAEAVVRVKCPLVRQSCWYAFATNCVECGKIREGIDKAFLRTYTVKKVEAKWNARSLYRKPQDFTFEMCFTRLTEAGFSNLGDVMTRVEQISLGLKPWTTVFAGDISNTANHWGACLFTIRGRTDDTPDQRWRVNLAKEDSGSHILDRETMNFHESNFTGDDTDVDACVKLTVEISGTCIWDYLPSETKLELK